MADEQTVDKTSYALIPPAGDSKVGEKVFWVLSRIVADKVKLGLHDRWFRNYQLRKGKHWKTASPVGVPLVSANLIFTHIQRNTNMLTDNNPTFNVVVTGNMDETGKETMMDLQRTTEHWWTEQEQQDIFETSVLNGETYGPAIEKVVFNPDLEFNLGEVETIAVDPFRFGWYPVRMENARDLQKAEVVLHFYPMSCRTLRAKYPKLAAKIKPDQELLKELMDSDRREISGQDSKSGFSLVEIAGAIKNLVNFFAGASDEGDEDETLAVEAWIRDKTQITEGEESRPKYAGGIRYVLACSSGVVLEDKDNPNINPNLKPEDAMKTYLYDKVPFCIANSVKDTSSAWGMTDIEQMEWLLMEINKCLSQLVLEKDRSARKKLIIPKDCGVKPYEATNIVGVLEPINAQSGQGIRWLETPPASVDYAATIEMFKSLLFLVGGTFDLDQAQVQGREVIAYKAIAALLERAATMSRGKIRSYSRLIRERGRMYLSDVMNFYTEERWITYKDKDGQQATKAINGSKMVIPAKLTVVSGSTMPQSNVQKREEALGLFEKGAIDIPELLDRLDWPNRSEVVKRMQAGPLGAMFEKMGTVQTPDPVMQFLKTIADADPKELQRAIEKGEFPTFMQFAQKLLAEAQGMQPQVSAEQTEMAGKMKELEAEVVKTMAEVDLIKEKTVTERINQTVSMAGVGYDSEMMQIKRAEVVHSMEEDAKTHNEDGIKTGMDFALKTHQTDAGHQLERDKMTTGADLEKQKIDQAGKPGYNENKGIHSNNKKG